MKIILLTFFFSFILQGCYSNANVGIGTNIGNNGIIGSNVQVSSNGGVYGNIGLGSAIRL